MMKIVATAGIVFSYLGFRQSVDLAGEARNPQRDVPRAIIARSHRGMQRDGAALRGGHADMGKYSHTCARNKEITVKKTAEHAHLNRAVSYNQEADRFVSATWC